MPAIRNSELIKRFTDYFKLKTTDFLDSEAGRLIVPVVNLPVPRNIVQVSDVVANDTNKTLSVPTGKQWKILFGNVTYTTTAGAGNRLLTFRISDGTNVVHHVNALNVQVASTTEHYALGNYGDVAEANAGFHTIPLPVDLVIPEGFGLNVFDTGGIDGNDDMVIRLIVEEIEVTGE